MTKYYNQLLNAGNLPQCSSQPSHAWSFQINPDLDYMEKIAQEKVWIPLVEFVFSGEKINWPLKGKLKMKDSFQQFMNDYCIIFVFYNLAF